MSHLRNILIELHNCLHEYEPEEEIPMVWSREFAQKLARNTDHWNAASRRASHVGVMDFQDEEDSDIQIPYHDERSEMGSSGVTYDPNTDGEPNPSDFGAEEEEAKREFKTKWGSAFRQYLNSEVEEEEVNSENDCPDCGGTGDQFPRAKRDCPTCKGTGKKVANVPMRLSRHADVKGEEEEDNVTTDPDKVARARKVRDRAVKVRDRAVVARDKAKEQRANEKGDDTPERTELGDDQMGDDQTANGEMGGDGDQEWDDPDFQGVVRTIPNAHLVSKRQQEDGTFEELWQYNIGDDFKKELKIRRAVLAGTDIPINKMKSPDNSQTYELWTVGNGQLLKIKGLPN